jgi:DNA repair exonuclease SbcCD ATPase subunit
MMVTRKRLSDLLREEAKKSLDDAAATPQSTSKSRKASTASQGKAQKVEGTKGNEANKEAIAPPPAPVAARKATGGRSAKAPAAVTAEANSTSNETNFTPNPTDLQETINDLQASLKTAQQVEQALRQEVATLEASLKDREKALQQLQTELERAHQDKSELEKTKQLALKLSESNIQLTREMEALKHKTASSPQRGASTTTLALRQILQHPVLTAIPSTDLTDDDIGWVD